MQCADGPRAQETQGQGECSGQREDILMERQCCLGRVSDNILAACLLLQSVILHAKSPPTQCIASMRSTLIHR